MKKSPLLILSTLTVLLLMGDRWLPATAAVVAATDQTKPELVLQTGHSKQVEAVIFSPENGWAASGSFDNTIKIWEVESGRELRSLSGHSNAVKALACSTDGKWLASGGNDGTVRIWDVESAKEVKNFDNKKATVQAIAFSPDGKRLASGGSDNLVTVRDLETGKELVLADHTSSVTALIFSPDGKIMASGSADHTVKIWDVDKGKKLQDLKKHTDEIRVLRFSDDGSLLASGGLDKTVHVWKAATGREVTALNNHAEKVIALKFISGDKVMSADAGGTIKTWDLIPKHPPLSSTTEAISKADSVESASFNFDGTMLAIGNGDGTTLIADTKTGKLAKTLENYTTGFSGAAFSSDGNFLAAASSDNSVKLWDLRTGQSLSPLKGHSAQVRCVAFHPDKRHIISGSLDKTILIWDTISRKSVAKLEGHKGAIESIAVGKLEDVIVSGSADKTIGIWEIEKIPGTDEVRQKSPVRLLREHTEEVVSVAISSDEQFIASGSRDGTLKIWDVRSGRVIRPIDPKAGEIDAVAISPDGKLVASGGVDKLVSIWDVETGKFIKALPGHTEQIQSISFSPDGKQIASSSRDKTVRIWDVSEGREIRALNGHVGAVYSAGFSQDSRLLTSASEDGSLIIWDARSGENLATLISSKKTADWLVVTPGGFFDGSQAAWEQLSWRFENNTFNLKPVEIFLKEFWLPGLLAKIVNGKPPANSTISAKDRRQPILNVTFPDAPPDGPLSTPNIKVRVTVSEAPAGAKDVRLFRNGSLVKVWREDVMEGKKESVLDWSVPIVAGENKFTAYAFNSDDIKSRDRSKTVIGGPGLTRKGIMYVLAIGVNEYANPDFNLDYAVNDAREFSEEFKRQQLKLNNYERVDVIPLIAAAAATKANIRQTLSSLATRILPEDALIVFFAGHGLAKNERFYMIPYDYTGVRTDIDDPALPKMLESSLSDEELESLVENIDVGQFLVVIDACDSGKAIETQETRQGPMNSKGLAQLAYDKGIYILTASQGSQSATENKDLGHGYLTYALIEGLKSTVADKDHDGNVVVREWLDYASELVPQIDKSKRDASQARDIVLGKARAKAAGQISAEGFQQPRVFYRHEADVHSLVVAKP